ncbi:excinuclease ABC subunit UvrB [bacterium]|nr:excinuclease ABC subunit UvrB [bacterium]
MFKLKSDYKPDGDQPAAIRKLTGFFKENLPSATLLGVTGSGKTFTIANVVEKLQKPTLVISHNKTLAAQLYGEFKTFFPENAVRYFVSYYDYYQPEAYLPGPDTYIEKDSSVNEELDRLRLETTHSLLERRDTIVVASVSCIFGIGSPEIYKNMYQVLEKGETLSRDEFLHKLVEMLYTRSDLEFFRGRFRVKGDVVEVYPSYDENALRFDFFGNELEKISLIDPLSGVVKQNLSKAKIYPARHYVLPYEQIEKSVSSIRAELQQWVPQLEKQGRLLEAERLKRRTEYDIEMIRELGFCQGIENYSRHLEGRQPSQPPFTLLDYMPADSLIVIDESHVTVPQIRGMHRGDHSRKKTLVEFGFRMPSAYDNRPLYFEEFENRARQVLYMSATPADYELEKSSGRVVEQIIRPTGLMDPQVRVEPLKDQVDHLLGEIRKRVEKNERVLVTTLTKRMAEDLNSHLNELGVKAKYLHSDIDTLERIQIIQELRMGEFDCLVGINLLREGLDLPEVSLVAILDADKEGFLRSKTSLVQTIGRAARHVNGEVVLYADTMTKSLAYAISETNRRREIQKAYNLKHGITPAGIQKHIQNILGSIYEMDYFTVPAANEMVGEYLTPEQIPRRIIALDAEMKKAVVQLDFEKAAALRDKIMELREMNPGRAYRPGKSKSQGKRKRKTRLVPKSAVKKVTKRLGRDVS